MLPVGDDNTGRVRTPYVTYLFIVLNVLVFVFLQGFGTNEEVHAHVRDGPAGDPHGRGHRASGAGAGGDDSGRYRCNRPGSGTSPC